MVPIPLRKIHAVLWVLNCSYKVHLSHSLLFNLFMFRFVSFLVCCFVFLCLAWNSQVLAWINTDNQNDCLLRAIVTQHCSLWPYRRAYAVWLCFSLLFSVHLNINPPWAAKNGAKTRDSTAMSLIKMLSDGPDVSLSGSPMVSPITAALWASEPLGPSAFAWSDAPACVSNWGEQKKCTVSDGNISKCFIFQLKWKNVWI